MVTTMVFLLPLFVAFFGQDTIWREVSAVPRSEIALATHLSDDDVAQVRHLLSNKGLLHSWDCETGNPNADWLLNLQYETLPLNPVRKIIFVEAGSGCARGAQGSNGAMWIICLGSKGPTLLASPDSGFNGWLYDVPSTHSHSYRDVVLGWHKSASEAGLSYFRFDGTKYRLIGTAVARFNGHNVATIVPNTTTNAQSTVP